LVGLAAEGRIQSAHDCAEGGWAVALAECCFDSNGIGADIAVERVGSADGLDAVVATLFGESASRAIVSVDPGDLDAVLGAAKAAGVTAAHAGRTGGDTIRIAVDGQVVIDCARGEAEARWSGSLAALFG
jgi:phosphoribosylformylglycinamidine synthase